MTTKIFHNPLCSKSRQALEILENNNINVEIVEYLKTGLDKQLIENLLMLLNKSKSSIRDIMRTKESEYKQNNLEDDSLTSDQLIAQLMNYPKLLERPIVIHNKKAAICRPPELVLELINT